MLVFFISSETCLNTLLHIVEDFLGSIWGDLLKVVGDC